MPRMPNAPSCYFSNREVLGSCCWQFCRKLWWGVTQMVRGVWHGILFTNQKVTQLFYAHTIIKDHLYQCVLPACGQQQEEGMHPCTIYTHSLLYIFVVLEPHLFVFCLWEFNNISPPICHRWNLCKSPTLDPIF